MPADVLAHLRTVPQRLKRIDLRGAATVDGVMLGLGAVTGLVTGTLAWLVIVGVETVQEVAWASGGGGWQRLLIPAIGGLLVGAFISRVMPEAGGGVVGTLETIALRGGRFRPLVPLAALVAVAIALGTGASGGREGPMVLIGGAVGSVLATRLPLDEDRVRALVAAGVAAGIGAAFNAPIGGMLFAIELVAGGIAGVSLQVIVVASVVSSITARQLVGPGLTYTPSEELVLGDPRALLLYALLGLLAVGVAVALRRSDDLVRRWLRPVRARTGPAATVGLGGLGVGVIALAVPSVLGSGDDLPPVPGSSDPIQAMLDGAPGTGGRAAGLLLVLLVAKLAATAFTHGSGSPVGVFAPTLFLGAALGGALGIAAQPLLPDLQPGAVATVGMAAALAASARVPLTAVVIVFELVGDYGLVLPLMAAVGIATFVADRVEPDSIYVHRLRERGVVFARTEDVDVLQTVTVDEVYTSGYPTVPVDLDRASLEARFTRETGHGFAVVDDEERLVGVISVRDLERDGGTAEELCTRRVVTVTTADPLFRAVRRMASLDIGRVPVLDPTSRRVIGMLRRSDVVRGYQRGITRSVGAQQRRASNKLRDLAGVGFVELVVDANSPVADTMVRDVSWPQRTVLTSVRRRGEVLVPSGETLLQPGDELVVLTADAAQLRTLLRGEAV